MHKTNLTAEEIEPDVGEEEINLCESAEFAHSSNSDREPSFGKI